MVKPSAENRLLTSRCVCASASGLNRPVTPRRTATGRFGVARTMAPTPGKRWRRLAASTPARSDTTVVFALRCRRSSGAISSSFCGLKPSTTSCGAAPASATDVTTRAPSTGLPLGRMTVTAERSRPPSRQPSRIAPPIFPHPTNHVGCGSCSVPFIALLSLSFAVGVDQRGGNGLARRLPAPQDELEDGIEALALLDRGFRNGFRLLEGQPVALANRVEDGRVAEHHEAGARPHLEMAEPELLVDEAQRLINGAALLGSDLDVGKGEELEDLVLGTPHAAKLVLRPAPRGRGDDLALAGPLGGPPARLEILLEDLDGSAVVALVGDLFFAQVHAPGAAFLPPPRFAAAGTEPAFAASSAAMRAFRISFSSRAAAAIAF